MTLQPFTSVTGAAAPLMRANIDTDVIIRIEHLTGTPRNELGRHAFEALRQSPDGRPDAGFVLNLPQFQGAPILLAGSNFGCGSSREHAVWALRGMGLQCVIAPSFGEIFHGNCFQNGLLAIRLPLADVQQLAATCAGGAPLSIDLRACTIRPQDGEAIAFTVDPRQREMLLNGLDDIGLTLRDEDAIARWQMADRRVRPWAAPRVL